MKEAAVNISLELVLKQVQSSIEEVGVNPRLQSLLDNLSDIQDTARLRNILAGWYEDARQGGKETATALKIAAGIMYPPLRERVGKSRVYIAAEAGKLFLQLDKQKGGNVIDNAHAFAQEVLPALFLGGGLEDNQKEAFTAKLLTHTHGFHPVDALRGMVGMRGAWQERGRNLIVQSVEQIANLSQSRAAQAALRKVHETLSRQS